MLGWLQELFRHQAHADASMLEAVQAHPAAASDRELRERLHHILLAHRYWIHTCRELPFSVEAESVVPETLAEIVEAFRATRSLERAWLDQLEEADLERGVQSPYLPGRALTLAQVLTQVCLHSHGHRAQCATRLRKLGGQPPATDYILWLEDRPEPGW